MIKRATFCSILGNDPKPSILDQDIFEFNRIMGETVIIRLESDPTGTGSGGLLNRLSFHLIYDKKTKNCYIEDIKTEVVEGQRVDD